MERPFPVRIAPRGLLGTLASQVTSVQDGVVTVVGMDGIERLRALCTALPEVTEKVSHGEPAWFVRKRMFVMFADRHHDDRVGFWCAAPPGAQEELVDGERYFRPPYVGHRGWLGVYLDVDVDWDEVAEVVEDAYRTVAPTTSSAQLAQR